MAKNFFIWFGTAIATLLLLTFVMPLFIVFHLKGFYYVLGGILVTYLTYLAFKQADSFGIIFYAEKRKKEPKMTKFKKFMLAFLGIAYIGVIGGFTYFRTDATLQKEGVVCLASITNGTHTTRKSLKRGTENSYSIEFTFKTISGEKITGFDNVNAEEFSRLRIGSVVKVIYQPSHPIVMRTILNKDDELKFKGKIDAFRGFVFFNF